MKTNNATNNVANTQSLYAQYQNKIKPGKGTGKDTVKENETNDEINLLANPVDTYSKTIEGAADPNTLKRLIDETNQATAAIRKLVMSMLGKDDASGQAFWAVRARGGYKLSELDLSQVKELRGKLQLSEADRAQAQEMIGEDGFFGVKQTTDRIMSFAKALVGENATEDQILNMRSAVMKGFNEVSRAFGGFDNLPDVSKQTYDAINSAFDEWLAGGASAESASAAVA